MNWLVFTWVKHWSLFGKRKASFLCVETHQIKIQNLFDSVQLRLEQYFGIYIINFEMNQVFRRVARSLVFSDLRSETKGSRFESGC